MNAVKVEVKEARLQQFVHVREVGKDKDGKPVYTREMRTLRPGMNLVPKDVVEQMRKNVVFMGKTQPGSKTNAEVTGDDRPAIVIHDGEVPGEATKSLDGLKPLEAVKLVQDTLDVEQLIAWKTNAKTLAPKVLSAIDNQLAKIDAMAGDKKE